MLARATSLLKLKSARVSAAIENATYDVACVKFIINITAVMLANNQKTFIR